MEAKLLERDNYTREEYVDLLESSAQKMEYHDGQIMMMAGATGPHNRITMNLSGLLYDSRSSPFTGKTIPVGSFRTCGFLSMN